MATAATNPVPPPPGATNALAREADIRPPKPPLALPGTWATWGLSVLVALLLTLAWLAWRRYRRERRRPPPAVVIPPYRRALERLRAALDLLHDPHRFVVVISDTLRVYLEERFNLHAPERTTEEFLTEVRSGQLLTPLQQQLMAVFLTRCDLVKFARYEPGEPELRELYDAAVRLVEETEPLLNPARDTAAAPPPAPAPAAPAPPAATPG
jgi:hypothetical protein